MTLKLNVTDCPGAMSPGRGTDDKPHLELLGGFCARRWNLLAVQGLDPVFCILSETLDDWPVTMLAGTDCATKAASNFGGFCFFLASAKGAAAMTVTRTKEAQTALFTAPSCSTKRASPGVNYGNYNTQKDRAIPRKIRLFLSLYYQLTRSFFSTSGRKPRWQNRDQRRGTMDKGGNPYFPFPLPAKAKRADDTDRAGS